MRRTACWIAFVALVLLGFASAPASACVPGSCVAVGVSSTGESCFVCVLHPPSVGGTVITCVQLGECRCVQTVCADSRSASTDWKTAVLGPEKAALARLPF